MNCYYKNTFYSFATSFYVICVVPSALLSMVFALLWQQRSAKTFGESILFPLSVYMRIHTDAFFYVLAEIAVRYSVKISSGNAEVCGYRQCDMHEFKLNRG